MSGKTNPLEEDGSPMPFQLQVQKHDSGGSGSDATPQVPEERSQWELASLDPSSWPIFGITSEGFAGIGVSKDGLIRDGEKSLHFALDQAALASITEGDASFNSVQFASNNVAGSLQEALSQAHEQNRSLRELCWDLVHLAADLEGKEAPFQPEDHEQLTFEARRSLHVIHSRLEEVLSLSPEEAPKEPEAARPPTPATGATPEDPVASEAPEIDLEVNTAPDVVAQEAKMLEQMADGGAFEGTPEITPQPGPFIPELTAGPTLLAKKDAQCKPCPYMSPVQRRVSQPTLLLSPNVRPTRSLICPSAASLARSVTCPVRHSPVQMTTRAQSPLHIHTTRGQGHSIVAPRFISHEPPRPFCEPITRATSPPLLRAASPLSELRELTPPAWKWQTSGPTGPAPASPTCWPRPAPQSCRPCWVLTRSTS